MGNNNMKTMDKRGESGTQTHQMIPTAKGTILVIDDDAVLQLLYRTILEMDGYTVITVQSGSEALAILSQMKMPALILLDMQMKAMTGAEFLVILDETQPEIVKSVPVVFLSGMDRIPASKASGFIRKPLDINTFLKCVHRFVERGVGQASLSH